MARQRRREIIGEILRTRQVTDQEQLVEILHKHGEHVTQATVSRDLAAMGVVKGPGGYVMPTTPMGVDGPGELRVAIKRHATMIRQADSLVVVRTAPGHAALVGDALDRWPPTGVIGTIAGDDTVMIATTGSTSARRVCAALVKLLRGADVDP
ncbi:MAG: arginine repressor [Phycisphaerales bacterium JB059]